QMLKDSFAAAKRHVCAGWQVLFYRAWISTFCLLTLGIVLTFESQTRDILWGIGETMQFAARGMISPGFRWAGVIAYSAFWFSGLVLAAVLALVARVTGLLEFSRRNGRSSQQEAYRRKVVFIWSQIVFVGALGIIHFAYLSEVSIGSI